MHQRPPPLTAMGELYYEGKEYEAKLANVRPGILSEALREALGMAEGAPPPWLINMQRYGPPPSYPSLKISGAWRCWARLLQWQWQWCLGMCSWRVAAVYALAVGTVTQQASRLDVFRRRRTASCQATGSITTTLHSSLRQ